MSSNQVKSAVRAFEILEYFKLNQQRRSMSEIASDLGYPQSSTTVLLKTLLSLGYLSYDRQEHAYFPTPKLTALGDWVPTALFGSGKILDAMRDVHRATGEGVFIGTKSEIYLQYTRTIESIHALRFHIDEYSLMPLTRSAAGWVLLSQLPLDTRESLIRRANIACDVDERVSLGEMEDRIAEIKEKGYAYAQGIPLKGGATLAVPLPISIYGQAACLALGGLEQRVKANFEHYLDVLRTAAASVSEVEPFTTPIQVDS